MGSPDPQRRLGAAGDAEVDQPRRRAHHEVLRLDVEVQDVLGGAVVQRRGHVQPEREQLLQADGAVALEQRLQGRALQVLEQQVGEGPVGGGRERAHHHRVPEALQHVALAAEVAQRHRIGGLVGPQHLGDQHGQPVVVPHEEHLVAPPAADAAQHGAAGGDRVALAEPPRGARAGRLLPRWRLRDRRLRGRSLLRRFIARMATPPGVRHVTRRRRRPRRRPARPWSCRAWRPAGRRPWTTSASARPAPSTPAGP